MESKPSRSTSIAYQHKSHKSVARRWQNVFLIVNRFKHFDPIEPLLNESRATWAHKSEISTISVVSKADEWKIAEHFGKNHASLLESISIHVCALVSTFVPSFESNDQNWKHSLEGHDNCRQTPVAEANVLWKISKQKFYFQFFPFY